MRRSTYLDIRFPSLDVWPYQSSIISHHAVNFAFNICAPSPNRSRAGVKLHLQKQLAQQDVCAIVPLRELGVELVRLLDAINSLRDLPQVFGRHVVAEPGEFALEADAAAVEGVGAPGRPGRSALWRDVVVVVAEVAGAVGVPAAYGIDEAGWVEGL